jgi:hypothetical protein
MKQDEESVNNKTLTEDQIKEINSYPDYWQSTLEEVAMRGESIKETYERLKGLESLT